MPDLDHDAIREQITAWLNEQQGQPAPPQFTDQDIERLIAHPGLNPPVPFAQRTPMPLLTAEGIPLEDVTPGVFPERWRHYIARPVRGRYGPQLEPNALMGITGAREPMPENPLVAAAQARFSVGALPHLKNLNLERKWDGLTREEYFAPVKR